MKFNEQKNIHLDFLNPDLRRGWGLFSIKNPEPFLTTLLNISVFLTKDKCYLPIVFILEDKNVFNIVKTNKVYFDYGYIVMPMKLLNNFDKTLEKLFYSYREVRENYPLFNNPKILNKAITFINGIQTSRVEKKYNTGESIAEGFASNLEKGDLNWKDTLKTYDSSIIKKLQNAPRDLISKGRSVTHGDIYSEIKNSTINIFDIHKLLNYEYNKVYMNEYDSVVLYDLFGEESFSPTDKKSNLGYSYKVIKNTFDTLNLMRFFASNNAKTIIEIRKYYSEYHDFIRIYFEIVNLPYHSLESLLALTVSASPKLKQQIGKVNQKIISKDQLIDTLGIFNESIKSNFLDKSNNILNQNTVIKERKSPIKIALFIALKEEEDIAKKILGLNLNRVSNNYEGIINGVEFEVFSPRELGRVPAAIRTFQYLSTCKTTPSLIIIAGIAGGFEKNNIERGDIVIPKFIIDVSNTKKEGKKEGVDSQEIIRFTPFQLSQKLINYVQSPSYKEIDEPKFLKLIKNDIEKLPKIYHSPISCCDSVIKDEEWINQVLQIHPQLLGVEMEAGGVCYAASQFKHVDICVIRGISDLANPYKADDKWREIAMKRVATLIKVLDFKSIFSTNNRKK